MGAPEDLATRERHKDVVRRLFDEVWSRADFARVREYLAPRCVLHFRTKSVALAPEDMARIVGRWKTAFPDLRFDVLEVIVEGPLGAARLVHRGTHQGEWRGFPPSGRTIEVHEMMFFRFEDGRIAEVWEVTDEHAEREQITGTGEA